MEKEWAPSVGKEGLGALTGGTGAPEGWQDDVVRWVIRAEY